MTGVQALELDLLGDDFKAADGDDEFAHRLATLVRYVEGEGLTAAAFPTPYVRGRFWPGFAAVLLARSDAVSATGARVLHLARTPRA